MQGQKGYMRRAWEDLTRDSKWWTVVLALGLLDCVPIIGPILAAGYLFDWAKEGAWNMQRPLPHELGSVSRRVKYGLYALVNAVIWFLPFYIVGCLVGMIPAVGWLLRAICNVLSIVCLVLSGVGTLRSTIYERVYPGLQVGKVLRMAQADAMGLFKVFCISLLALAVLAIALLLILIPALPLADLIETSGTELLHGTGLVSLIALGMTCIIVGLFVWIAGTVCITLVFALYIRALGCWAAQFEPGTWSAPEDEMPFEKVRKEHAGPVRPTRATAADTGTAHAPASEEELDELLVPLTPDAAAEQNEAGGQKDSPEEDGAAADVADEEEKGLAAEAPEAGEGAQEQSCDSDDAVEQEEDEAPADDAQIEAEQESSDEAQEANQAEGESEADADAEERVARVAPEPDAEGESEAEQADSAQEETAEAEQAEDPAATLTDAPAQGAAESAEPAEPAEPASESPEPETDRP